MALRWSDVDVEAGIVTVRHGKGDKERVAAILDSTDGTKLALERLQESQLGQYRYIFASTTRGRRTKWLADVPTSDEVVALVVEKTAATAGLGKLASHDLRRLLQGHPPKKLVLMTATPVNNSLWDLYNLLSYFVGHDAAFASQGIRSLRQRFKSATDQDPYDLRLDMLFDVLDETTVRRTRHFIKKYYPNEEIPGMGGQVIRFPEPKVKQVEYSLDAVLPGFFDDFAEALAPDEGDPKLTLARYWPSRYRHEPDPETNQREAALVGLLRSGLLKRFESSVNAFARTAKRMADSHEQFLAAMDRGVVPNSKALGDWGEIDNDEALEELLAVAGSESIELYRDADLRRDIELDRDILRRLSEKAFQVERETDPKLEQLVEELAEIAAEAERPHKPDWQSPPGCLHSLLLPRSRVGRLTCT